MGLPTWALLLLVVYPLLQIPLVLYLARWFELDGDAPVPTPARTYWTGAGADESRAPSVTTPAGLCGRCGTENDPAFVYCRSCVAPLASDP